MHMPLAFLTGQPGPGELILLFIVILLLFGPRRLPEIAKMIGKTINQLRRASQDFKDQIMNIEDTSAIDVSSEESPRSEADKNEISGDKVPGDESLDDEEHDYGEPDGKVSESGKTNGEEKGNNLAG